MKIRPISHGLLIGCVLGAAVFSCTETGATELSVHLVTAHERGGYKYLTPGLSLRTSETYFTLNTFGYVKNSIGNDSVYMGRTFNWRNLGLTVGGITGYHVPISPLVVPSIQYNHTKQAFSRLLWLERKPNEPDSSRAISYQMGVSW